VLPAAAPPDSPLVVVRAEELSDVEGHGGDLRPRQGPPPPREDGRPRDGADVAGHGQPAQDVKQDIVREPTDLVDLIGYYVHGIVSHRCTLGDLVVVVVVASLSSAVVEVARLVVVINNSGARQEIGKVYDHPDPARLTE
jgi:hypothetical protein